MEIRIQNARSHNLPGRELPDSARPLTVVSGVSGLGQVDARLRHAVRRGPAPLRGVALDLRAPVPRAPAAPGRRLHLEPAARDRDRAAQPRDQRALDGRHRDRDPRPPAPALREDRRDLVPGLRAARRAGHGGGGRATRCSRASAAGASRSRRRCPRTRRPSRRCASACCATASRACSRRTARWSSVSRALAARARRAGARRSWLLIDRLVPRAGDEPGARSRRRGRERLRARAAGAARSSRRRASARIYREGFACDGCGRAFPLPEPALFSFNSPLGACPTCQGFGRTAELDRERVVPDPTRSIDDLAIAPFATPRGLRVLRKLQKACALAGVPDRPPLRRADGEATRLGVPRRRPPLARRAGLLRAARAQALQGAGARDDRALPALRDLRGAAAARACAPRRSACGWAAAASTRVCRFTLAELCAWLDGLELPGEQGERAGRLLEDLRARVGTARRGGPRLPHARPPDAHALGRRGAAHPARDGARRHAHRVALRARRALDRPARARRRAGWSKVLRDDPRPGQHGGGGRARARDRRGGRPRDRSRPARRAPRRPAGGRGRRGGAARASRLADRPGAARRVPRCARGRRARATGCSASSAPARTTSRTSRSRSRSASSWSSPASRARASRRWSARCWSGI